MGVLEKRGKTDKITTSIWRRYAASDLVAVLLLSLGLGVDFILDQKITWKLAVKSTIQLIRDLYTSRSTENCLLRRLRIAVVFCTIISYNKPISRHRRNISGDGAA
ncbi:MAG: hypothetical protein LUI87_18940 [Lachnospiraceae bacterium]|nr:hypothetical protein [Lachnospiraceae bacterium]